MVDKIVPIGGEKLKADPLSKARVKALRGERPIQARPVSQSRLANLEDAFANPRKPSKAALAAKAAKVNQVKTAAQASKLAPKAGTMSAAGGTAKQVLGAGRGGVGVARPSGVPLPEGQSFKAAIGRANTVKKASLALEAARQPGVSSTDRMRARINLQKQQTAKLNKLGRLARATKKVRNPVALAFSIGLEAIIQREIDIQNNPTGFQPGDIL